MKKSCNEPKDTTIIPKGDYCYKFDGRRGVDEKTGLPWMGTKNCPYMTSKEFNGVTVHWCDFLECGDVGNYCSDEDYKKLLEHFGSEKKLQEVLPLLLLWDGCKECGENTYDDDDERCCDPDCKHEK
jgi:hypothetical protein